MSVKKALVSFLKDESGAALIEYALLAALIAVVAIVAMTDVGTEVKKTFQRVHTKLQTANT